MPSRTAARLESAATIALVASAPLRSALARNWRYQWSVNPLSGNDGSAELLNEKISRITIGAYRKTTTKAKNAFSSPRAVLRERDVHQLSVTCRAEEACEDGRQNGDDDQEEHREHRAGLPVREARSEQVDDLVAVHVAVRSADERRRDELADRRDEDEEKGRDDTRAGSAAA